MTKRLSVTDTIALSSRTITPEGYLIAKGRPSRTGIQEYRAFELGLQDGGDPMRVIRMYRPPEEVFDAESLTSFNYKPIVDDHKTVDSSNWKEVSVGDIYDFKKGDYVDEEGNHYTESTLVVKDASAVAKINAGKVQLSNGYDFHADWTPGKTPTGQAYDAVQRKIRGNHVALVDAARCGSACRVGDSQTSGEPVMPRTVTVDGIPVEVNDQAAAVIEKQTGQIKTLTNDVAARDAQLKETIVIDGSAFPLSDLLGLRGAVAKLIGDRDAAKKDVFTPEQRDAMVADWAETLDTGKRLFPGLDAKGKTCHAVRLEVLGHVGNDEALKGPLAVMLGGKEVKALDQETARTAFRLVASLKPAGQEAQDAQARQAIGDALLGNGGGQQTTTQQQTMQVVDSSLAYHDRMANAWKKKEAK